MGDQNETYPQRPPQSHQFGSRIPPQALIERRQWLIEQQQPRAWCQAAGQRDPLLLAARQFSWPASAESLQPHQRQHRLHALTCLRARHTALAQPEPDIRRHRHVREQRVGLEHRVHRPAVRRQSRQVGVIQHDAPGLRPNEPADGAQQRCLSGSGTTQQDEKFVASGRSGPADRAPAWSHSGRSGRRPSAIPSCSTRIDGGRPQAQSPALKRAHSRVRARSAAGADGPMVKNRCMTASVGYTFGSFSNAGRTSTRVAGTAFG